MFTELFPSIASYFRIGIIDRNFEKEVAHCSIIFFPNLNLHFQFLSTLCKDLVKQRRIRKMEYNDVLNNLIEVAAEHMGMTEDIMYKTCVQFFTDGYDSAAQALEKFFKLEFDFFY